MSSTFVIDNNDHSLFRFLVITAFRLVFLGDYILRLREEIDCGLEYFEVGQRLSCGIGKYYIFFLGVNIFIHGKDYLIMLAK